MHARVLVLAALALLLAPGVAAHGSHGLHLQDVVLAFDPLGAGQQLRFVLTNDPTGDATDVEAHVTLMGATFRETHALPDVASGATLPVVLELPGRIAPRACLTATAAGARASDEVCVLASAVPIVPIAPPRPR